jgi:uncharacterized protein YybS (DUF2232 family)
VAMLFAPAPILIFAGGRARANLRAATSVILAAIMVLALASIPGGLGMGAIAACNYLATFGVATVIIVSMIERKRPFELIVLCAAGGMFIATVALALVLTGGPVELVKAMQTELAAGMARGQEMYRMVGMQNAVPPEAQSQVLDTLVKLSPALAAILAAMSVLLNLRVFWRWRGKQQLSYALFGDLVRWSAPEWLIWGLIATGFGMLAPITAVSDFALNAFLCFALVYFCQGLAIMAFYFQALSVPGIVRAVIYFIAIVQPVVSLVVCLAGVFDMWIDFRRLKPPSREAGNYGDFL